MPQVVDIPDVGLVEFPDGMSEAELTQAAGQAYAQGAQARVSPNPVVNQPIAPSVRLDRNAGLREQQRQAAATGETADTIANALGWADFLIRPFASTAENPLGGVGSAARGAGQVLNEAGTVAGAAVRDVRLGNSMFPNTAAALSGTDIGPSPGGAIGAGLDAAGQALPLVAGGMALQAAGVPAAAAFGGPMAASALDASGGDINTALKAGATGALIPGVAQLGREAAANALGRAVAAGVRTGGNVPEKIAEALAAQGVVQVFMEGLNLPDYVRMEPEQRREALLQNLVANTAFLAMDVPGVVSRSGSLTSQTKGGKVAQVGAIMEHLVNEPAAMDRLRAAVDDMASQALNPRRAGMKFTPPEIQNVEPQFVDPSLEPVRGQEVQVDRVQVPSEPAAAERPAQTIEAPTAPVVEAPATAPEPNQALKVAGDNVRSEKPPLPAETITGSNEQTGSEMPAEREKRLKATRGPKSGPRPWDIIDEIEGQVGGKIDPTLIQKANPDWRPTGAARRLFARSGRSADSVLNAITYGGPKLGLAKDTPLQEFGEAINRAAEARKGWISQSAENNRQLDQKGKQLEQFERKVLVGERPKVQADNVERVPVQELIAGDTFKVQDHEFRVRDLEFDDNGDLVTLTVEDGPKFGVQVIEPNRSEFVHIDKGTFKPIPREAWTVPEAEGFNLNKPESVEEQRVRLEGEESQRLKREQAEKLAIEAAKPLIGSSGDIGQRDMLGGGDLFSDPARSRRSSSMGDPSMRAALPPNAPATPPPGSPGVALLFDQRLPVTLDRTAPGAVSVPQVMKALEGVIQAAGGQTPIRVGRFNKSRARGVYSPQTEVTRINAADNIPTATHEIGHASQKLLYGTAYARGLKGLPPQVKRELVALGKALYGSTKPAAGYSGEGWAEFIRHYITTDDAAKVAPTVEKYFREKVLVDHPEFARAVAEARQLVDGYRAQGSISRAQQQLVKAPGTIARIVKTIRENFGLAAQVDEFDPLWRMAKGYAERSGNQLAPYEDPFLLASWKRGTAGAVVETMVNDAMVDPWGNPYYGPGNLSLRQALAPIKGRGQDFALYLFGRRAVERWGKNKNPGITLADAEYLVQRFDSPEFQLAAQNYYEWNRGLLEYVRAADPAMGGTIDAILTASQDYAPLARVIDPRAASSLAANMRSNPLQRMRGSGRQVRDIFETTLENAARMVSHSHRKMVLEAIVKLSQKEGMGFLVEEVPRDKVRVDVNFEKLREQLDDMGVDTSMVDEDAVLTYFDLADKPKGADPIVAVKMGGGVRWFHVSPAVYDLMTGLDPVRLHPVLDLLVGAPARAFRLGTTGLRPSFSLFTNPTRDLRTLMVQTQSDANPARLAASYLSALGEVVRAGAGGERSPHVEAFYRLGAQLGQPLGVDIRHTRRAAKELFHGRTMRIVTNPVDHLRDILQITEAAPRVAELKLVAEEVGWEPGRPMTPDQAVQLALAAKRVTVDFSAAGRISRVMNQAIPFYNASIQGSRSFLRTLRDNPARAILYGLATFTVPALANWWANKDKEWYRQLPWRERYLYDNIDDGENVWQIPRPPEWGNWFSVLPEAMLDSWYRRDPRGATEALKHLIDTSNPLDYPVPLKIAKEQWQNRIDFFDRPIVPRSQVDLPPGDQRGPYTTKLAEWIGDAFPETVSPRRIDAGVRSYFGGAVPDLLDAVGLGSVKRERGWEPSDLPVLGRMFRRGGEFSPANLAVGDYYDDLSRYSARGEAMQKAMSEGRPPLNPLDGREQAYWQMLESARPLFKEGARLADMTHDPKARQSLYRNMAREASRLTALRPK